jgi:hypothetical protein
LDNKKKPLPVLSENLEKVHSATKYECIEDLRALQAEQEEKHISRNFYRNHGKYADSVWSHYFGTFREFRRQAGIELSRQQHQLEVHTAKHASYDHYSDYYEKEVLPFHNKYNVVPLPGKIKTMLICSDLHDEEIDEFCLEVFIDTCLKTQPDHIVFNGDIYDLYEFSRYSQDPRHCNMEKRFKFVRERIFKPIREACPNAQIDFIMGNHEHRLIKHLADRSPFVRILLGDILDLSFSDIFGLDEFKINWYSKSDLKAFTPRDINNSLKKNYKIFYDCYVVCHQWDKGFGMSGTNGHHHQVKVESDYSVMKGPTTWVQTPGMHQLDAEYLDNTCKWNLGFLKVYINTETKNVIQLPISVHSNWAIVEGVLYTKK